MLRKFINILLLVFVIVSCNTSDKRSDFSGEFNIPDSLFEQALLPISEEAMGDIIQNISSPIEMAALIKESGHPFSQKYLCTTDYVDDYNTSYKQALNLGTFGADLGYLNIYNKTGTVINYISAIKSLADNLKIGQFFDFSTLKRLATSSSNLDSLMYVSLSSFNKMDEYLRENNRSNISTLIVTGVWIEGLYLATQVIKEIQNDEIAERIGEQKIILNDLLLILKNYRGDKNFADLIKDIEKIKKEFDNVKITYELGEPESIEQDGMLVIIQNETSIVEITDEQLNNIIRVTEKVRNKVVSL